MVASVTAVDPIRWEIEWTDHRPPSPTLAPASRTEGRLSLEIDGESVWPKSGPTWTWIELLEWLGDSWTWLVAEDGLPVSADPESLDDLRRWLAREMRLSPESERDRLELTVWDFLSVHDLAQSLKGAQPSSVVVWREGLLGHILTATRQVTCAWSTVKEALERLGQEIYLRLDSVSNSPRAHAAREVWDKRNDPAVTDVLSAAGIADDLADYVSNSLPASLRGYLTGRDGIETSEILAAARMSSGLPPRVTKAILSRVLTIDKVSSQEVDAFANRLRASVEIPAHARPYDQGYAFAEACRMLLSLSDADPFHPKRWLARVGVHYEEIDLSTPVIDAFAAWGAAHGPAVLLNTSGKHSRSARGRNASVAHEIGHLLLDREGALAAADVLGGRANPSVEARARAFAVELLLPRAVAGSAFGHAYDDASTETAVRSLTARYGVSPEVVAWQARNSAQQFADPVGNYLRGLVQEPQRF